MFCKKCGTENEKGAKFCKSCGSLLAEVRENVVDNKKEKNVNESIAEDKPILSNESNVQAGAKRKMPVAVLAGAATALVLLIIIIAAVSNSRKTINLNDYMTIESSGYDGYGTAEYDIDWDAIEDKYGEKLSFTSQAKKELSEYGIFADMMTPMDALEDAISLDLSEKHELSNGDVINYTWDIEDDLQNYVKCKLKYSDGTYSVSNLTEVGRFDPFADLSISFSRIAPDGRVGMDYSGSEFNYYDFDFDKTSGLHNGDKVKVTIAARDMSYYAENYGKIPESLEKEYTVEGLDEYVDSYSDIPDATIDEIHKEVEDTILAYVASSYNKKSSLKNLSYSGYVFNTIKDSSSYYGRYNRLYVIYSGDVSNTDNDFRETKVYFPVEFHDFLSSNGDITYESGNDITDHSSLGSGWYSTKGYINPLVCYMEIAESNRDSYNIESGDGFEKYSEQDSIGKLVDISDEYKETLKTEAKDTVESYISSSSYDGYSTTELEYVGEYLLIAKSQAYDYEKNNRYVLVYKTTVTSERDRFDPTTVYFSVEYNGIVKLPDDEYMVTSVKGITGSSDFPDTWYGTKGYVDGEEMFSKVVTANRDNYTYEMSEGLKEFGE